MGTTSNIKRSIFNYRLCYNKWDFLHAVIPGFVYLFLCIYAVSLANAYVNIANPTSQPGDENKYRLPDVLLDNTYPWFQSTGLPSNISDTWVQVAFGILILKLLLSGRFACILFRRAAFNIGTIYLLRSPTVVLTMLPQPLFTCVSDNKHSIALQALVFAGQSGTPCGDVFFSGHTIIFTFLILIYSKYPIYFNQKDKQAKIIYYIELFLISTFSILGMLSLVVSAYHYCIDVLASIFLCITCWFIYHLIVETNYFNKNWFGKIILWFDAERRFKNPIINDLQEIQFISNV